MTRRTAADVSFFLIDGQNVLGTLTDFEDKIEARTEEAHALGDAWAAHKFVNVREGELTQNGFYDDEANSVHDALSSGPGSTRILSYCLEGTATGAGFVAWAGAVQVNYQRLAERDALTKAKATYKTAGVVEQGKVLLTWSAPGSTGRKGITDNAVSSTNGGFGYLHYNASAGEANIRILHNDDGGTTWVVLGTFTKTASGHGAERITITGSINRYACADITTATATGTIAALNAFVGLVRNPAT